MFKYTSLLCGVILFVGGCSLYTWYKPQPLDNGTVAERLAGPDMKTIKVEAQEINHPLLAPVEINLQDGLSPDEAAILAVFASPELTAKRDERGLAQAEIVQAGILPNPELGFGMGYPEKKRIQPAKPEFSLPAGVVGGGPVDVAAVAQDAANNAAQTAINNATGPKFEQLFNAYDLSVSWEITSLLPLLAKVKSAKIHSAAVNLDIAWQEWQTAEAAKLHVYRLWSLTRQQALAREAEGELGESLKSVREAVAKRAKTVVELAAAQVAFEQNHLTLIGLEKDTEQERLELNKALGLPPQTVVPLQKDIGLPVWPKLPTVDEIMAGIEDRRLDLVALKVGYGSQEEKLRAEILAQFPKLSLGYARSRDTSKIVTNGFTSTLGIPIFDRNQGAVATEKATRQQLFDEYISRLFDARAESAKILTEIGSVRKELTTNEEAVVSQQHLVEVYNRALLQGNADAVTYYNARIELINKRIEVLKLRMELVEQGVALELAAGRYFQHTTSTE